MVDLPTNLEIERVMNLIRGFGWTKIEEVVTDTEIKLTITKPRVVETTPTPT